MTTFEIVRRLKIHNSVASRSSFRNEKIGENNKIELLPFILPFFPQKLAFLLAYAAGEKEVRFISD